MLVHNFDNLTGKFLERIHKVLNSSMKVVSVIELIPYTHPTHSSKFPTHTFVSALKTDEDLRKLFVEYWKEMIHIEREGRGLSKNAALNMSACGNDVQDMLMSLDKSARKSRMVGDRPCIEMCLDQMYVPHLVT